MKSPHPLVITMVIVPSKTMGRLSVAVLLDGTDQAVNMVRERTSET